jgi:cytoskeleton protein RodZ
MVSFGENLRRERELRGIELAEIAAATKIGTRFLDALEQGRMDILPGGMFPRAFLRQYAAFVGLDVERTVADFVRAQENRPSEAPASHERRPRRGWSPSRLRHPRVASDG